MALTFQEKEKVTNLTTCYQTHNGTFFYHDCDANELSVRKIDGTRQKIDVPGQKIASVGVTDDALFVMNREGQVYKVPAHATSTFTAEFVRDVDLKEKDELTELCKHVVDGQTTVYRMWEEPSEGIVVDASEEDLKDACLTAVHRGKVIYEILSDEPLIKRLSDNVVLVGSRWPGGGYYVDDASPFIYWSASEGRCPTAIVAHNMETMASHRMSCFGAKKHPYTRLIGVSGGKVVVQFKYIINEAELPAEFALRFWDSFLTINCNF